MQKRAFAILAILLLAALGACGGSETTGKRVAAPTVSTPTGGAIADVQPESTPPEPEAPKQTAAEALKEVQATAPVGSDPTKVGNFYPPVTTTATGKDALKEKTRALFQQASYDPNVQAVTDSGPRYYDSNGNVNLPSQYTQEQPWS